MNYGVEYQHSEDHSSQHYSVADNHDFDDVLREDVASLYAGAQRSFDWGLSFNASAKGEYYHNRYQHNWNFIPVMHFTFDQPVELKEGDNLTMRLGLPQE